MKDDKSGTLHWPGSRRRLEPLSGGWGSSLVPCNTTDQFFTVPDMHISTYTSKHLHVNNSIYYTTLSFTQIYWLKCSLKFVNFVWVMQESREKGMFLCEPAVDGKLQKTVLKGCTERLGCVEVLRSAMKWDQVRLCLLWQLTTCQQSSVLSRCWLNV